MPLSSLIASIACSEAMTLTIGPKTPAVSQVGCAAAGGGSGMMQDKQGVSPGTIASVCPSAPTQPPNTHGRLLATA